MTTSAPSRRRRLHHLQAGLFGLVPGGAALAQADGDLDAGVVQVLRVGVALRAVADDGDLLALDQAQVGSLCRNKLSWLDEGVELVALPVSSTV
jgi:hypothetical protein